MPANVYWLSRHSGAVDPQAGASQAPARLTLHRCTRRDLGLAEKILALTCKEGDLLPRTAKEIRSYIKDGSLTVVLEPGIDGGKSVVAVVVGTTRECISGEILELAMTVVSEKWRGKQLGKVAASAAMIWQASLFSKFSAILCTLRPTNMLCHSANTKFLAPVYPYEAATVRHPYLFDFFGCRRGEYSVQQWQDEPSVCFYTRSSFDMAVTIVDKALNGAGFRQGHDFIVVMDDSFRTDGFAEQVSDMAASGWAPDVLAWDLESKPTGPRLAKMA